MARFAKVANEDVKSFCDEQENANTKRKNYDVKVFLKFHSTDEFDYVIKRTLHCGLKI